MGPPEEAQLLSRAQRGDRAAFGGLVRMHQRRVYACALQMLADAGEAEDATQEAFLRAWRAIARFDRRSELSTWLYRITVNVCLNTIRKRRRVQAANLDDPRVPEPPADPTQGDNDPGLTTESAQLRERIQAAMNELTPALRTTVVLVLMQGLPHKQVAQILSCPEGTIAWRVHEARRRLRDALIALEAPQDPDKADEEQPDSPADAPIGRPS